MVPSRVGREKGPRPGLVGLDRNGSGRLSIWTFWEVDVFKMLRVDGHGRYICPSFSRESSNDLFIETGRKSYLTSKFCPAVPVVWIYLSLSFFPIVLSLYSASSSHDDSDTSKPWRCPRGLYYFRGHPYIERRTPCNVALKAESL